MAQLQDELSEMSFEDIQKLKENLGLKIYNEVVLGRTQISKRSVSKNRDQDAPIEMSSKQRHSRNVMYPIKKNRPRDPRFDSLCGTYDAKHFKKSYSFVSQLKENDLKALKKELCVAQDPDEIEKIKYLIERLENQLKEESRKFIMAEVDKAEKKKITDAVKKGEKPEYRKKSEKKKSNLLEEIGKLEDVSKLKKHIQRIKKKNVKKIRNK